MLWYYLLPHAALYIIEFDHLTLPNFVLNALYITNSNTFFFISTVYFLLMMGYFLSKFK